MLNSQENSTKMNKLHQINHIKLLWWELNTSTASDFYLKQVSLFVYTLGEFIEFNIKCILLQSRIHLNSRPSWLHPRVFYLFIILKDLFVKAYHCTDATYQHITKICWLLKFLKAD
jgi:hypothetical protein